jgi:hypothetical protein
MADLNVDLGIEKKDISAYFDGGSWAMVYAALIIGLVLWAFLETAGLFAAIGLVGWAIYSKMGSSSLTDAEIDSAWEKIAESRRDEAHRVALIDKEDTIRDAEWFFAWPDDFSPDTEYKSKEGEDTYYRRNHQRLVYMIYGKDQLAVFGETICIEDNWDGEDDCKEYYWKDVSSMGFDQKSNTLELACGPKIIKYPLAGDDDDENGLTLFSEKTKNDKATEISNSVRVILRERKA